MPNSKKQWIDYNQNDKSFQGCPMQSTIIEQDARLIDHFLNSYSLVKKSPRMPTWWYMQPLLVLQMFVDEKGNCSLAFS